MLETMKLKAQLYNFSSGRDIRGTALSLIGMDNVVRQIGWLLCLGVTKLAGN